MCSAITTYNFPSVWIEQSNEEWNNGAGHISFGSSNLVKLGYAEEAQRNFSVMSTEATAHCPSVASRFHYMMDNQVCNTGVIEGEMAGAAAAGYPMPNTSQYGTDDAPYYFVNTAESGSLEAQAAAYAAAYFSAVPAVVGPSGTGCIATGQNDLATIGSNNFLNFYEEGPSSAGGPAIRSSLICQRVVLLLRRGWRKVGCKASNCCEFRFKMNINSRKSNSALAALTHRFGAWSLTSMATSDLRSRICVRLQWVMEIVN